MDADAGRMNKTHALQSQFVKIEDLRVRLLRRWDGGNTIIRGAPRKFKLSLRAPITMWGRKD